MGGSEIHEPIHIVRAPGARDDGRPDFLVNDVADLLELPDTVHLSDGSIEPVVLSTQATFDREPTAQSPAVTLHARLPSGFVYLRVHDPADGQMRLARVVRSDGREVRLGDNAWTTDRTFLGNARPAHKSRKTMSTSSTTTAPAPTRCLEPLRRGRSPTDQPRRPTPANSTAVIPVQWSGQDNTNGTGIAFFDVFVSTDGGPFAPWQTRKPTITAGCSRARSESATPCSSVATDVAGNREPEPTTPDAFTTVTRTNRAPVLEPIANRAVREGRSRH